MQIKVKKTTEGAKIPTYGTDGASAFDLYSAERTVVMNEPQRISLGIAVEVPKGYAMLIMPRSSTGLKTSLRMANSTGVIDSDYRGEISALYEAKPREWEPINVGDRIAQGMIVETPRVEFVEVDELSETERGNKGFGSTGK